MSFGKITIALIAAGAMVVGMLIYYRPMELLNPEHATLKTIDGETIAGLYEAVPNARGGIVFLHMMPATKESWSELSGALARLGYAGLAIDLRGHGESSGGPKGYQHFGDAEHQKSILDVDAAAKFLLSKGIIEHQLVLVGASIGANLALKYLADHHEIKMAVLLSAGLNYRGIETSTAARALASDQRVLLVGARDDGGNAGENEEIFTEIPEGVTKHIELYESGGHGTDLLEAQPRLTDLIIDFITK
jgi:pimeloyl-ACP methyl ester carboxylesterase